MEATLDSLSRERTIEVVRAFAYFSNLANIAEDQHNIRSARALARSGSAQQGTIRDALIRIAKAGVPRAKLHAVFSTILVSPVLTAHPSEVRRKSVLDREMEVAKLLEELDSKSLTPDENAAAAEAMSRAILTLWQTSPLRHSQPTVIDEVANGLSYYDSTFLRELPVLYGDLEDQLAAMDPAWNNMELRPFFVMGSWIGGDRDGNPYVTADVLRQTVDMQSRRVLDFYLEELHLLGGELSLDGELVSISVQLQDLIRRSPDESSSRETEPYRRAIVGIYARLVATAARAFGYAVQPRHAVAQVQAYSDAAELRADLDVLYRSLSANGSALLARGRLRNLRRAVEVFGFHLASVDLRQNSDVHERVLIELARAGAGVDYGAMDETARVEFLLKELGTARPLISPFLTYSGETSSELEIARTAAQIHRRLGRAAIPNYVISKADDSLGCSGSRAAAQGGRPAQADRRRTGGQYRSAVRDHR